jgi:hypothetical protein
MIRLCRTRDPTFNAQDCALQKLTDGEWFENVIDSAQPDRREYKRIISVLARHNDRRPLGVAFNFDEELKSVHIW